MTDNQSIGDTGLPSEVSADEEKERIDQLSAQHSHGASDEESDTDDASVSAQEDEG